MIHFLLPSFLTRHFLVPSLKEYEEFLSFFCFKFDIFKDSNIHDRITGTSTNEIRNRFRQENSHDTKACRMRQDQGQEALQ